MKKKILLILLTLLLVPKLTYAEELPREGVHYFMDFPNNEEIVTKDYNETGERLIYTGKTNDNGEIVLTDWNEYGQLRIVQKVPSGYSTDQKEIIVDLSDKKASFVNYRGITNPETGRSFLLTTILLGTIISLIILVKTKDKKKYLLIIPVITILCLNVKAESEGFVISVKDRQGNSLKDVEILVYAKPKHIEASPAIEINVNGGKFLNGKEIAYIKLDSNGKPMLDDSIQSEITVLNILLAIKDGYTLNIENLMNKFTDELTNDTVVNLEWTESTETKRIKFHGNGGKFKIDGKILDYIEIDKNTLELLNLDLTQVTKVEDRFLIKKPNNYLVGYDANSDCMGYDSKGFPITIEMPDDPNSPFVAINPHQQEEASDFYLCWNPKPDGIYVNEKLVGLGNVSTCYSDKKNNSFKNNMLIIDNVEDEFVLDLELKTISFCEYAKDCKEINSLKIVDNGETVVELTKNDLEKETTKVSFKYKIINYEGITNYFSAITTTCGSGGQE